MKKETLIDFMDWIKLNYKPHKMYTSRQLVDLYLKSINEASNESLSVRDNEGQENICPECNGDGGFFSENEEHCMLCPKCEGSGLI